MSVKFLKLSFVASLIFFSNINLFASGNSGEKKEELNVSELIFHHVKDNHDWHIADLPKGDGEYLTIAVHLPWIIYNSEKGIEVFSTHDAAARGYHIEHDHITSQTAGERIIDFSITKTSLQMLIVAVLMLIIFIKVSRRYNKRKGQAPTGVQSFFEPIILFVKNDIADPNIGEKSWIFMPYFLTLFFFIWFSNLFGLTPLNSNIAGNISVTAALALITFLITTFKGSKDYWKHIFWFPNVPLPIRIFIMMPIEIIGMFTKPFALMIRLFANITAGHFMVLALISLIFIMGKSGESIGGAAGIAPLSILFTLFIAALEMLVAVVQAYVFTLLTAVFIGQAMATHEEHH